MIAKSVAARVKRAASGNVVSRLLAFMDQGFQGIANVLIALLLARSMNVIEFASAGLAVGLFYFFFSFHRSSIILPFILNHSREGGASDQVAIWWTASTIFGIAATTAVGLVLGVAVIVGVQGWVVDAVIYLSVMILPMTGSEFGRRAAYQMGRPGRAVTISFFYLLVGTAAAWFAPSGSPHVGGFAYAAAGLAGCSIYLLREKPSIRPVGEAIREFMPYREFAVWQSFGSLFSVLYTTSVVVLVATFAGPVAAAIYTAARTLVNPALSIVSAVDSFDKPRAARALTSGGIAALRASVARTRLLVATLTGCYLVVLVAVAPWLLKTFFGDTYVANTAEVRVLALGFFLMCMNQPSETFLVVLKSARRLFAVRCVGAILAVVSIFIAAQSFGITGAVWAIVFVQVVTLAGFALAERSATQGWILKEAAADAS